MKNRNETEMPDKNDSGGLLDDTRSETISVAGRPHGSTLRQRHHQNINESAADYADLFRTLQIRPEQHERFLDGVLKVIRQKNIKELQRATDASIKLLTSFVLRGYRNIVWKENGGWLLEDGELDRGEERLLPGGDNERFYPLLEPIWWRMRDLVFEPKPPPKGRVDRKRNARIDGIAEDAYEADNDTEFDIRPPHDRARDQTLRKINKLIANAPEPSHRYMSADETDTAIVELIVRLADTRARSDPDIFQQLWDQHIGRVDELEGSHQHGFDQAEAVGRADAGTDEQVGTLRKTPTSTAVPQKPALSNEPFATAGNPIPQSWPRAIPAQIPATMAIYISTAPPSSPYTHRAYEWLDAPVRMVNQHAFYAGLMLRVSMRAERVKGLVTSYGWCDVCRWIAKGTAAGEKEGWSVLQRDLAWAAERGVRVWRMKVLVVGT